MVKLVADNRVAECLAVYAQLMRTAGHRLQCHGAALAMVDGNRVGHLILGHCLFTGFKTDLLFGPVGPVANERQVDFASFGIWSTENNGLVLLADRALFKLMAEVLLGSMAFGEKNKP